MQEGLGIKVEGVSFAYNKDHILKDINMEIPKGTFAALLGPNGVGKSTLLKTMSGYLKPQRGRVLIGNRSLHSLGDKERSRLVTYLAPEYRSVFKFTVEEAVMMGRLPHSDSIMSKSPQDVLAVKRAMAQAHIDSLQGRLVTSLSSGERQRVQIARALCQDPSVFLLDEPTSHLDMRFELEVMELVKNLALMEGRTVLAIFHDVNLGLRYASRIFLMKAGKLAYALHPKDLTSAIVKDIYGVESRIFQEKLSGFRYILPCSLS